MKRLTIAFLFLLSILLGCTKTANNEIINNKTDSIKTNSVTDNYEISVNESFQFELSSNPSTGYSWKWINKESVSIVDTIDYKHTADNSGRMGASGTDTWKFKGIKPGTDTIKLEYNRGWEPNSAVEKKTIVVKVKESNNIKPDYEISTNEIFQIELKSNITTGFSWKWINKKSVSIIDSTDHKYTEANPGTIGGGGKEIWKFKGKKSGIETIIFQYCQPWEHGQIGETKKITVRVK